MFDVVIKFVSGEQRVSSSHELLVEAIIPAEHNRAIESVYKGSQNNSLAIPVWDLEKDAWRSFRVDRILDFNQEEITE